MESRIIVLPAIRGHSRIPQMPLPRIEYEGALFLHNATAIDSRYIVSFAASFQAYLSRRRGKAKEGKRRWHFEPTLAQSVVEPSRATRPQRDASKVTLTRLLMLSPIFYR